MHFVESWQAGKESESGMLERPIPGSEIPLRVREIVMQSLIRFVVPVFALIGGCAIVSLHLGCNNSSRPEGPASVRGRVTFQGQPVANGMVIFTPDRERGASGKPLRCDTGADGVFELKIDGAVAIPPGWYRVSISPPAADPNAGSNKPPFPPQLRRPDTSTLSREVVSGKENVFEFAVEVPSSVAK